MRSWLGAIAALIFVTADQVCADDQISPDIASRIANDLRQSLPAGYDLTILDPLTIKIGPHGSPPSQLNLDNINRVCIADPNQCDTNLAAFAAKIVQFLKDQATPPSKEQLRAVVRPKDYVEALTREMKGQEPVALALTGDLVELCYFDMPTTMRIATAADIESLGLTSDDALALCKRNVDPRFHRSESQLNMPTNGSNENLDRGPLSIQSFPVARRLVEFRSPPNSAVISSAVPAADCPLCSRNPGCRRSRRNGLAARRIYRGCAASGFYKRVSLGRRPGGMLRRLDDFCVFRRFRIRGIPCVRIRPIR